MKNYNALLEFLLDDWESLQEAREELVGSSDANKHDESLLALGDSIVALLRKEFE